ncbi:MAG TPA: helix-turn-helix domain-containing protein [Conexibacter sp.]|jgi:AcrR family transcriptional regulator
MAVTVPREMRKDARRNRAAIVDAARELFAESADVSMCQVAKRAGVGQATLYRNFPDRSALAAEILGDHVDRLERIAAEHTDDPDAFFVLLRSLIESMVHIHALGDLARQETEAGSRFDDDRRRLAELMKRPLCDAKTAGTLRRDASLDDVFLLLQMTKGAMAQTHGPVARAAAAARVLTLTLDGLAAPNGRG